MRIKSELLWGDSIQDKSGIYDLLRAGKLPLGYYLLVCSEEGQLEFIPWFMQTSRYYQSGHSMVFGIAHGKDEAYLMVERIISDIYVEHKYESVQAFAREVFGEPIC